MKDFRNGALLFSLPDNWVEDVDADGSKVYFRKGDEAATLRVNAISATKPNPQPDEIANLIKNKGKKYPDSQYLFANNKAILYYEQVFFEGTVKLRGHFWESGTFIPPNFLWSVAFSYIYPEPLSGEQQIKADVQMLWESFRNFNIGASLV